MQLRFERIARGIVWAGLLAGLAVNITLASYESRLAGGSSVGLPGCSRAGLDCGMVLSSPFSRVLGVSLTTWAFGYYGVLGLALVSGRWYSSVNTSLCLAVVTAISAVAATWLVLVMRIQIGQYCLWCLALHGVNLVTFLAAVYGAQKAWERELAPSRKSLCAAFVGGGVLVTGQLVLLVGCHDPAVLEVIPIVVSDDPVEVDSLPWTDRPIATLKGNPQAAKRLLLFVCVTCSHCRRVNEMLESIMASSPDTYAVELRFAPRSGECDPRLKHLPEDERRAEACPLARSAIAVAHQRPEAFSAYLDWLYENQDEMTLERALAKAQLDEAALETSAVQERLAQDLALAQMLRVDSVPQLLLPRGRVSGPIREDNLRELLASSWQDAE